MPDAAFPVLSYHQQRLLRCRRVLTAWLRRWGAYGLVLGLVLTVGTNAPLAVLAGALGALVLPLAHLAQAAVARPGLDTALALLASTGACALLGALPVVLTRPLWWPARWAQAERALPLAPAVLRQSDRRLLAWLLLPSLAPWAGALGLAWGNPALVNAAGGLALAALLVASLGAAALGLAWMQAVRRGAWRPAAEAAATSAVPALSTRLRRLSPVRALVWWPLWRGVARRTAHALLVGGLATPALAAAPLATPASLTGWWLAALAGVALASTAWLRARSRDELAPLWAACRALPLATAPLAAARRRLVLLPALAGLVVAGPVLARLGARPAWAGAYLLLLAGACWREAHPPPPDATHHASRWLLTLALAVCAGTEVMP